MFGAQPKEEHDLNVLYDQPVATGEQIWQLRLCLGIPGGRPIDHTWYVLARSETDAREKLQANIEAVCAGAGVASDAPWITAAPIAGNVTIFPAIQLSLPEDLQRYQIALCLVPVT